MPGRHVTAHEMRLYMTFRQTDGPAIAAAKSSISTATAYRYEQEHRLPSSQTKLRGRRRPDPLIAFHTKLSRHDGCFFFATVKRNRPVQYRACNIEELRHRI